MIRLSDSIQRIKPSATLALAARAAQLKAQGRDIISFTVGEPDFDSPQHVKAAAVEALEKGLTKYTPVIGIPALRGAIQGKLKRDQGLDYALEEIIVSNGGKQALAGVFYALLNPGDEVIIPAPYWTSYPDMVLLTGASPVVVPTTSENGYLISAAALKAAISPKTRMFILNSPSNPTGGAYSKQELAALAQVIKESPNGKEIIIVSDEVYEYFTYDGFEHYSLAAIAPELRDQTVIVNALSKSYAMTGWRVGYAVGPKELIAAVVNHQSQTTSNVCSIAQYAASKAFDDNGAFPRKMIEAFNKRLDIVVAAINEIDGIELPVRPRGAFYAFLRVEKLFGKYTPAGKTISSGSDFGDYLLSDFDVVVVPGEAFGDAGALRISFACDEETLKKGLKRIADAATTLK